MVLSSIFSLYLGCDIHSMTDISDALLNKNELNLQNRVTTACTQMLQQLCFGFYCVILVFLVKDLLWHNKIQHLIIVATFLSKNFISSHESVQTVDSLLKFVVHTTFLHGFLSFIGTDMLILQIQIYF